MIEPLTKLDKDIRLIYKAVEKSKPYRTLSLWKKCNREDVLRPMRRAIFKVDKVLPITTDALEAAFEAGLKALLKRTGRR